MINLKNMCVPVIAACTIVFLANKYSGESHQELWERVEALLDEIERLRQFEAECSP